MDGAESGIHLIQLKNIVSAGILTVYEHDLEGAVKRYYKNGPGEIEFLEPRPRRENPLRSVVEGFYREPKIGRIDMTELNQRPYISLISDGFDEYVVKDLIELVGIIGADMVPVEDSGWFFELMEKKRAGMEFLDSLIDGYPEPKRISMFRKIERDLMMHDLSL